jgi:DNA-binding FrmR family transcriptional regulator
MKTEPRVQEPSQNSRAIEAGRRAPPQHHLNIEAEQPCLVLAQQLHAVEKAINQAKKTLIKDHLDHCLDAAAAPLPRRGRKSMAEFKEITKYL